MRSREFGWGNASRHKNMPRQEMASEAEAVKNIGGRWGRGLTSFEKFRQFQETVTIGRARHARDGAARFWRHVD